MTNELVCCEVIAMTIVTQATRKQAVGRLRAAPFFSYSSLRVERKKEGCSKS